MSQGGSRCVERFEGNVSMKLKSVQGRGVFFSSSIVFSFMLFGTRKIISKTCAT